MFVCLFQVCSHGIHLYFNLSNCIICILNRIRLNIMQHIPHLAKQLGKDFFSEKLTTPCVGWLRDDISTIRQAAAENLKVSMDMVNFQKIKL